MIHKVMKSSGLAVAAILMFSLGVTVPEATAAETKVKLLSAGKGKKQKLRFTPKVGDKQTVVLVMEMTIGMQMGEMKMPPTRAPVSQMTLHSEVVKVESNGDIRTTFAFGKAEVIDDAGLPPEAVASMRSALESMEGAVNGHMLVNASGHTKEADFKVRDGVDPQMTQLLDGMKSSLEQLTAPFPDEAVGVGAKWKTELRLDQMAVPLDQDMIFELKSFDGKKGRLSSKITQSAKPGPMRSPGLPPGVEAKLISLEGKGDGEINFDLSHMMPIESGGSVKSKMASEISGQGQTQKMSMDMDMKFSMKQKK